MTSGKEQDTFLEEDRIDNINWSNQIFFCFQNLLCFL